MPLPPFVVDDLGTLRRIIALARTAIAKPTYDEADVIPLEQTFRMFEQYRYDAFDWRDPHKEESFLHRITRKRAQGLAKSAFTSAHQATLPELSREECGVQMGYALRLFCKGKCIRTTRLQQFLEQLECALAQPHAETKTDPS